MRWGPGCWLQFRDLAPGLRVFRLLDSESEGFWDQFSKQGSGLRALRLREREGIKP